MKNLTKKSCLLWVFVFFLGCDPVKRKSEVEHVDIDTKKDHTDKCGFAFTCPLLKGEGVDSTIMPIICRHGKYGLMRWTGKIIAYPIYDHVGYFHNGKAIVGKDGTEFYIDTSGMMIP